MYEYIFKYIERDTADRHIYVDPYMYVPMNMWFEFRSYVRALEAQEEDLQCLARRCGACLEAALPSDI